MFVQNISNEVWGGEGGKYRLKDSEGNYIDQTPEDTCKRVAAGLANIEENSEKWKSLFCELLLSGKFAGGGRIMANVGAGEFKRDASPINCTVLRQIPDSMEGIMQTAKEAAMTLRSGAGVGYDFSPIRPKGAYVFGAGAETSGVISFMKIFDSVCSTVMSGGGRRGAQMGCLDIQHPEIENFITCKREDGVLRYFNLSVLVTDAFMNAVVNDEQWRLWFWEKCEQCSDEEIDNEIKEIKKDDIPFRYPEYEYFKYAEDHVEVTSGNCSTSTIFKKRIFKVLRARELFNKIMRSTYDFAEPGFILIDRVNKENILSFAEVIRATNPSLQKNTKVSTFAGVFEIKDLADKKEVLVRAQDGSWAKARVFLSGIDKELYKITLYNGENIYCTAEHKWPIRRITSRGNEIIEKKMTIDLESGDKILKPMFDNPIHNEFCNFTREDGFISGWLYGDGWKTYHSRNKTEQYGFIFSNEDKESGIANRVLSYTNKLAKRPSNLRKDGNSTWTYCVSDNKVLERFNSFGLDYKSNGLPKKIWQSNHEYILGFIDGLFSADGYFEKTERIGKNRIILTSAHEDLVRDVQELLSFYGITSFINKQTQFFEKIANKIVNKEYIVFRLRISSLNAYKFAKIFSVSHERKNKVLSEILMQDPLEEFQKNNIPKYRDLREYSIISDIEKTDRIEDVYDMQVFHESHAFQISSGITSNCGEQPLPPNASCLLASMILPPYVENPFCEQAQFDWDSFEKDIALATRMMDNVVEINNLPLDEMDNQIRQKRRHGLGFTGLGTVFNLMGMAYGDEESQAFAEKVAKTIARVSLIQNVVLAKEKGCAPIFETKDAREAVLNSNYIKRVLDSLDEAGKNFLILNIKKYGLRFSHATSIAPTGTMSLTWGNNCSNGIEPSFTNEYARNIRQHGKKTKVQEFVRSLEYHMWVEMFGERELPEYWRVSDDLSVDDHILIQAAVQKWVDSAVSKTANVPTNYPFKDFKNIYIKGWESGLKGVTTFRFNPKAFSGVLVRKEDLENTKYVFVLDDNTEVTVRGNDTVEYDGELHNAANLFDALKEGMYGDM